MRLHEREKPGRTLPDARHLLLVVGGENLLRRLGLPRAYHLLHELHALAVRVRVHGVERRVLEDHFAHLLHRLLRESIQEVRE